MDELPVLCLIAHSEIQLNSPIKPGASGANWGFAFDSNSAPKGC